MNRFVYQDDTISDVILDYVIVNMLNIRYLKLQEVAVARHEQMSTL